MKRMRLNIEEYEESDIDVEFPIKEIRLDLPMKAQEKILDIAREVVKDDNVFMSRLYDRIKRTTERNGTIMARNDVKRFNDLYDLGARRIEDT